MKENGTIKVSLGVTICIVIITLLLCIIAGLYYFGFMIKDKNETKSEGQTVDTKIISNIEKKEENVDLTDEMTEEQTEIVEKKITTATLKGIYKGKVEGTEEHATLELSENGSFAYYCIMYDAHYEGYYIIEESKIKLYRIIATGNDVSARIMKDNTPIELKINEDNSLTDNTLKNVTLKKESSDVEELNLVKSIDYRLQNNWLLYSTEPK